MSPEIPKQQIVYEASREYLLNNLAQLQRLQEEGVHIGTLPEKTWDDIVELIENRDEEELKKVRKELSCMNENSS